MIKTITTTRGAQNRPRKPKKQNKVVKTVTVQQKSAPIRAARKGRGRGRGGKNKGHIAGLAESIINPWSDISCVPDGSKYVGCFKTQTTTFMLTGAQGVANIALQPDPAKFSYAVANTGSNWSFSSAAAWSSMSAFATLTNQYALWRPLTCGLKVNYIGSTNSDMGFIYMGILPAGVTPSQLDGLAFNGAQVYFSDYRVYPLKVCSGKVLTWRPNDEGDLADWQPFTAAGQLLNASSGTNTLVVGVFGAAASTGVLMVEITATFQGKYKNADVIIGVEEKQPPAQAGWYENAANVFDKVSSFADGVSDVVNSNLARRVREGAMAAGGYALAQRANRRMRLDL